MGISTSCLWNNKMISLSDLDQANIFNFSVSPLDNRYFDPDSARYMCMQAEIQYYIDVELKHLYLLLFGDGLSKKKFDVSRDEFRDFSARCKSSITAFEVYEIECNITKHDIAALIYVMRTKTENPILKNLIHLGLTSYDIIHTARSLQLKDILANLLIPLADTVYNKLKKLAILHDNTYQSGRTHGQIASPTVFGHLVSSTVARLSNTLVNLDDLTYDMPGKISGPVGTQAALSILVDDPKMFEYELCNQLDLVASKVSSQLLPPDHWMRVYDEIANLCSALSKFANDTRHLQRPEINEVIEGFAIKQKGSSAMPHKRNPIRSENIVGSQKTMIAYINLVRINQETEHQRDLTGSIVERFYTTIPLIAYQILKTFDKLLDGLYINTEAMSANLAKFSVGAISESLKTFIIFHDIQGLYIQDPYSFVQNACFKAIEENQSLNSVLLEYPEMVNFLASLDLDDTAKYQAIVTSPETFVGTATQTIHDVCSI
jgi:adenylosuccinate lyase